MSYRFRQAICNEAFEKWSFADACKTIRKAGYEGIEIAPFTLAEDPAALPVARRKECRDTIASEGLLFVGLHWLMVSPKGLHVTTPDDDLRSRSWQHIRDLIDLCADLGPDGVTVEMPVRESAFNSTGNLHGGSLATLIDVAAGTAAAIGSGFQPGRHHHFGECSGSKPDARSGAEHFHAPGRRGGR